jgi:DNA invertase Pin-like site-specific DNA recombinase
MKIWGYCRASTAKQVSSPATQKDSIANYCKSKGLPLEGAFFVDPATSGKKPVWDRPAGSQLMKAVRRGDHIVVAKLDRLTRSFVNFAMVLDQFERLGIILHIVDMGGVVDPSNPHMVAMVHMIGVFAEWERRIISIRTQEGLHTLKQEGGQTGANPPYGKKFVRRYSRRLGRTIRVTVDNEVEIAVMDKLLELRAQGHTLDAIRQYLNYKLKLPRRHGQPWSQEGLRRALQLALVRQAQMDRVDREPVLSLDEDKEDVEMTGLGEDILEDFDFDEEE